MAKLKKTAKTAAPSSGPSKKSQHHSIPKEIWILIFAALTVFFAIALYSYHPSDPSWSVASTAPAKNFAGKIGAVLADLILSISGVVGFLIPVIFGYWVYETVRHFRDPPRHRGFLIALRAIGFLLVFSAGSGFFAAILGHHPHVLSEGAGGMIGQLLANALLGPAGELGSVTLLLLFFLIGLTLLFGLRWTLIARVIFKGVLLLLMGLGALIRSAFGMFFSKSNTAQQPMTASKSQDLPPFEIDQEPKEPGAGRLQPLAVRLPEGQKTQEKPVAAYMPEKPVSEKLNEKKTKSEKNQDLSIALQPGMDIPSIDVLDEPEKSKNLITQDKLDQMSRLVEAKLADFSIPATVVGAYPGPIVTRFELQLAPGMKVNRLTNLVKDLARSLSVLSVRIVEVIPGKPYVGLEVPNPNREIVRLKEVLRDPKFSESKSPLLMGLGKDISGKPEFADLSKMPHVLVAGTTGSGKSVGLNAMLLSMLLRSTPDRLRLIMIDPKMLELSIYEGIPHLLTPVVTDMNQAANALRWCVKEMDQRYRTMAALGVRNIAGLNEKIDEAITAGKPLTDPLWQVGVDENAPPPLLEKMPYIVVLVDEFADMIMVVGKKVEELICRLAQKARAAGIHLILATQRPSVDVITGLIKANIPTRIAFQVSSKIDSRTILDQQGAEQLLGYGDMLYLPPGTGVPIRVHGAFVADHEVHHVVAAWRVLGAPNYIDTILKTSAIDGEEDPEDESGSGDRESDPLYDEAVQLVLETQRASISAIQRRFRIGYNRAATLVEAMEAAGLVSSIQNNGMREVLVKP